MSDNIYCANCGEKVDMDYYKTVTYDAEAYCEQSCLDRQISKWNNE